MKKINRTTASLGLHSTRSKRAASRKKSVRNARSRGANVGSGSTASLKLSPCAVKFASAIANPFAPASMGACIPDGNARPSRKGTGFVRGTFYSGANGIGHLIVSPAVINDTPFLWGSTTGNTLNAGTIFAPYVVANTLSTNYAAAAMGNLPYSGSDVFAAGMLAGGQGAFEQIRIVAVGIKVYYAGTELNKGGVYRLWSDPQHASIVDDSYTSFGSKVECDLRRVTDEPVYLRLGPTSEGECQFNQIERACAMSGGNAGLVPFQTALFYPWCEEGIYNVTTFAAGAPVAAVAVNAAANQAFEYEVVMHWESVGMQSESSSTPNNADPVGRQTVLAATSRVPAMRAVRPHATPGQLMYDALCTVSSEAVPVAGMIIHDILVNAGG